MVVLPGTDGLFLEIEVFDLLALGLSQIKAEDRNVVIIQIGPYRMAVPLSSLGEVEDRDAGSTEREDLDKDRVRKTVFRHVHTSIILYDNGYKWGLTRLSVN
jgi:hypothetical protein